MKRIILLITSVLVGYAAFAQADEYKAQYEEAVSVIMEGNNATAYSMLRECQKKMEADAAIADDKVYANVLMMQARCLSRLGKIQEAIETAQRTIDYYGEHQSKSDIAYARYVDNISLYYIMAENLDEADARNSKAVELFSAIPEARNDLAIALTRKAEIQLEKGNTDAAIKIELSAMQMLKELKGQHSNEYIGEMQFLYTCYEKANDSANMELTTKEYNRLKEEAEHGYVPQRPVQSAEEAKAAREDMRMCIRYYLSHYLNADRMKDATQYIIAWASATDEVSLVLGDEISCFADEGAPYLVAYMAGCCKYAINSGDGEYTEDMFISAMSDTLNYYLANKDTSGDVKALDKYVKLYEKDPAKMIETMKAEFASSREKAAAAAK